MQDHSSERGMADSDATLMRRVQAGETDCFGEIVRRYQGPLTRLARSRLGRADWAEEVVQETFFAAFKSRHSYNPAYSFRTWLWTILLNQCRGHYQSRARAPRTEPWPDDAASGSENLVQHDPDAMPLARLLQKERSALLESLLNQLSSVQADALRLRFFGGLKFGEIADTMGCSLNTAKNRVRWGLLRLAELLQSNNMVRRPTGSDECEGGPREECQE